MDPNIRATIWNEFRHEKKQVDRGGCLRRASPALFRNWHLL